MGDSGSFYLMLMFDEGGDQMFVTLKSQSVYDMTLNVIRQTFTPSLVRKYIRRAVGKFLCILRRCTWFSLLNVTERNAMGMKNEGGNKNDGCFILINWERETYLHACIDFDWDMSDLRELWWTWAFLYATSAHVRQKSKCREIDEEREYRGTFWKE